jgi:ketosteroid isomerase-like protein
MGQGTPRARTEAQRHRALVEQTQRERQVWPFSEEVVFVSGAFPEPLPGLAARRAASADLQRRNVARTATLERLEVAAAGDLAYACGTHRLEGDTPEGARRTVDGAYPEVWRQHAGEWRIEATGSHPLPDA